MLEAKQPLGAFECQSPIEETLLAERLRQAGAQTAQLGLGRQTENVAVADSAVCLIVVGAAAMRRVVSAVSLLLGLWQGLP